MSLFADLIERMKVRPEMWQQSHPLFKNKMARVKFWHRLAKEMNANEGQLRKSWKYLTDQYRREYKKVKTQEKAIGESVESSWAYFEALSFLKPGMAIKHREKLPVWVPGSSESDNNDTNDAHTSYAQHDNENATWQNNSHDKKGSASKADLILRKLQSLNATIMQSQPDMLKNDEDCMFFMSIIPMVRNLSPVKKLQLRGKINDWLLETLSEDKEDPLNSVSQYAMVEEEEEDDKQAVRDQIMAAEDDD